MKLKKFKRAIVSLLAVASALPIITMPAPIYAASETTPYNWYVKRNDSHTLPALESSHSFITKYRVPF